MRKASGRSPLKKTELLAFSTGLAGCLMMVLAFAYILLFGHAIFVEPNRILADIELSVFGVGGVANLTIVAKRLKE